MKKKTKQIFLIIISIIMILILVIIFLQFKDKYFKKNTNDEEETKKDENQDSVKDEDLNDNNLITIETNSPIHTQEPLWYYEHETKIGNPENSTSTIQAICPKNSFVKTLIGQQGAIRINNSYANSGVQPNINFFKIICSDTQNTEFYVGTDTSDPNRTQSTSNGWKSLKSRFNTMSYDTQNTSATMQAVLSINATENKTDNPIIFLAGGGTSNNGPEIPISCPTRITGFEFGMKNNVMSHYKVYCEK
jgi:hypothetical protein